MEKNPKLAKAMARTVLDHPFFATILLDMRLREDRKTKTACTNGREIRYNPAFINALRVDQIVFVLAHLVMHVAHLHPLRRSAREKGKFNKAGDYAINGILKDAGLSLLPGALYKKEYDNLAAEQIYEQLPGSSNDRDGNNKGDGDLDDDDPGGCGGFEDARDEYGRLLSKAEKQHEEAKVTLAIQRAAQVAKAQGKLPSSLERLVDEMVHPILDWREMLRTFIDHTARNDYSWLYPNRRHIAGGLYLPSFRSNGLKPLVLAVDTSGSIGQGELNQFQAELNDILHSYPSTVHVVYCDSEISGTQTVTPDEYPVELRATGFGGTDLRPPFEWAIKNVPEAGCIIYLTDLQGKSPEVDPGVPTLWISTTKDRDLPECYHPKFGKIATLEPHGHVSNRVPKSSSPAGGNVKPWRKRWKK
ncbi:MAG TPA: VWA-like domain-containing protein [Geobacteraceae bacterium]|nr:VWA-like domain-containing protein [Geobacteraceae bacterium]